MESNSVGSVTGKMTLKEFFDYSNKFEGRLEFVDGHPVELAHPWYLHQDIVEYLFACYSDYLKGKPYDIHIPWSIKLFANIDDIRVPDLFAICDGSKVKTMWLEGTPDLVIEV